MVLVSTVLGDFKEVDIMRSKIFVNAFGFHKVGVFPEGGKLPVTKLSST